MGCFDSVMVPCPKCENKVEFQTKSGPCMLKVYEFGQAPADVMEDVNRHAPHTCEKCGTAFEIDWADEKPIVREVARDWKAEYEEALESRRLMGQREDAAIKKAMQWESAYWALVKAIKQE